MVDAISNSSSLLQTTSLNIRSNTASELLQQTHSDNRFGSAVSVDLSDEAKAHIAENQEIFSGLTAKESDRLFGALGKIDKLFQSVGDREPTEAEEQQLEALENEIVGIIGEEKASQLFGDDEEIDFFENLSESDSRVLENILINIDQVFEEAGEDPLNASQRKQLEEFAKQADSLLGAETAKLFREELNGALEEQG